jgi:hypothetical protein
LLFIFPIDLFNLILKTWRKWLRGILQRQRRAHHQLLMLIAFLADYRQLLVMRVP